MSRPVDLDALARLGDERDFLLRSMEDLDAEFEAGDIDEADYRPLQESYVARTATVLRDIEALTAGLETSQEAAAPTARRRGAWVAAVAIFAVVAGVLLAQGAGTREAGEALTGDIDDGGRGDLARCQGMAELDEAVRCFDELLAETPENPDALAYKGWAMYRGGERPEAVAIFERVAEIDGSYPDVAVFRAVAFKDSGDFEAAQVELTRLRALNPPPGIESTITQMGLDTEIALGLLAEPVAACWEDESKALDTYNTALLAAQNSTDQDESDSARGELATSAAELLLAAACFDAHLEGQPDDVDALTMKALGLSVLRDDASIREAIESLDLAIAIDPEDDSARLIRAAVLNMDGDPRSAGEDLNELDESGISPLYRNIDVSSIRADVAARLDEG